MVTRPVQGPSDLPDLTDRLKTFGVYDEYVNYSKKYRDWRLGEASGARGELSSATPQRQPVVGHPITLQGFGASAPKPQSSL